MGRTTRRSRRVKQTVCEAELIYVYDSSLSGTAASLVCPNCGAPVEELGVKKVPLLWVCSGGVRGKIMESPDCLGAELRIV